MWRSGRRSSPNRCWGAGVAAAGPSVAAFFANLTPLFTALLSTTLLAEPPKAYHALAFGRGGDRVVVAALGVLQLDAG
jgi:drug/metabolite transporter (DMT)-like permease